MDPKHKALSGLKITDATKGEVEAVFATLNVKDSDGDVTLKGAFEDGAEVRISAYNHESWKGALPVGKGTITEQGDTAVLKGSFFLDTTAGRDTFAVVKEMGDLQEWSYGFDVVEAEPGTKDGEDVQLLKSLKVHEVSPVILGAGVGTRTLAVKGQQMKLADHLDAAIAANEAITTRVAEAVAQRAEKGQQLAEATQERCSELEDSQKRLREALAIEPPTDTDNQAEAATREYLRSIRAEQLGATA